MSTYSVKIDIGIEFGAAQLFFTFPHRLQRERVQRDVEYRGREAAEGQEERDHNRPHRVDSTSKDSNRIRHRRVKMQR